MHILYLWVVNNRQSFPLIISRRIDAHRNVWLMQALVCACANYFSPVKISTFPKLFQDKPFLVRIFLEILLKTEALSFENRRRKRQREEDNRKGWAEITCRRRPEFSAREMANNSSCPQSHQQQRTCLQYYRTITHQFQTVQLQQTQQRTICWDIFHNLWFQISV